MIFVLKESLMNGTVTMATTVVGVEAETFEKAVEKVRAKHAKKNIRIQDEEINTNGWHYFINNPPADAPTFVDGTGTVQRIHFPTSAVLERRPLEMLKD